MNSTEDNTNVLETHKFCTVSLETHEFKHEKTYRRKSQKLHQRQISDFTHMGKENNFEGFGDNRRVIKKKKLNSRFSEVLTPTNDDEGKKEKCESSLGIKMDTQSTKFNSNRLKAKEEDSMDSDNENKHRTSLMDQNKSEFANSLKESLQSKKKIESNSNFKQSKFSNGTNFELEKCPEKEFDEESEVRTLTTESESSLGEEYIEREVVYKLRFHLAPVIGPSLEMPTRLESFQVNIEYECTGIEKVLISDLISPEDEKQLNKSTILQSEANSSILKKDEKAIRKNEATEQKFDVKEAQINRKESSLSLRKDKLKNSEILLDETKKLKSTIVAQKQKLEKEIDPDAIEQPKESKLKSATNVLSFTILPSAKSQKKLDLPPRRSLNLSEESHKIFKSHPFLDNALKNRNKIQSKLKRSEPTERPTKYNQKIQEGSLEKHKKEVKEKEKDKLKATKAIAKRNINELKLKETIKEAKLEVIPEVNKI